MIWMTIFVELQIQKIPDHGVIQPIQMLDSTTATVLSELIWLLTTTATTTTNIPMTGRGRGPVKSEIIESPLP